MFAKQTLRCLFCKQTANLHELFLLKKQRDVRYFVTNFAKLCFSDITKVWNAGLLMERSQTD